MNVVCSVSASLWLLLLPLLVQQAGGAAAMQSHTIQVSRRLTDITEQQQQQQQQVSPCPLHPDILGYQDMGSLQEDINNAGVLLSGDDFVLCPGIAYVQGQGLVLMARLSETDLVIRCADVDDDTSVTSDTTDSSCVWQVEQGSHLIFQGGIEESLSVQIKGIVFTGATESSVKIDASDITMFITFHKCTWRANFGDAVVEITNTTTTASASSDASSITQVSLEECLFDSNSVQESVLHCAAAAKVIVQSCDFIGNRGSQSIIKLQDGALGTIQNVAFVNNTVTTPGLVFVDGTARINENDLCGTNNAVSGGVTDICNGTFLQIANPDSCININDLACAPACVYYNECDIVLNDCVSTVRALRVALSDVGGVIVLCSDTIFQLDRDDPAFEIGAAAAATASLQCRGVNCIIKGGTEQFRIVDGATAVSFEGITFRESQRSSISIEIDPTEPALIEFKDCEWSDHEGDESVISALYSLQQEQKDPIEAIVRIRSSTFKSNNVEEYMVDNRVLKMSIEDCTFEANLGLGLLAASGGETSIRSTSLGSNAVTSVLFFVAIENGGFEMENVCGLNNAANICNGTLYEASNPAECLDNSGNADACEQVCMPLLTPCQPTCYSAWAELNTAIVAASQGETFEICANTRIELESNDEPIKILQSGTVLRCGSDGSVLNDCVVDGGSSHFVVDATSASFLGIAFSGASTVSIQVFADLVTEPAIVFNKCYWRDNTGTDTFEILHSGNLSSGDRRLQNEQSLSVVVEISDSLFSNNLATGNIISNKGADLMLSNTDFNLNEAGGFVVYMETDDASSTLIDVRFENNAVNLGVVYIGFGTALNRTRVCGSDNTSEDIPCEGVFLEPLNSEGCKDGVIDACRAACSAILPCSNNTEICYSEWSNLRAAVELSKGGDTFVICPSSAFSLLQGDVLQLREDDTVIRCGEDGERNNRCVFFGGEEQLRIKGTATGIRIEGITFVGSSAASVAAVGENDASATFYGCEFSGHRGKAVILVDNENVVAESKIVEDSVPTSKSMEVRIESCLFDDNAVELAPIANIQGKVIISKTSFNGNSGLQGAGAVVSLYEANLSVSESCFVGNAGNISGAILLSQETAQSFSQAQNYGENNAAAFGSCTDILTTDESSTCEGFESSFCLVDLEISTPISAPLRDPTTEPIGVPPTVSLAPSNVGEQLSPTQAPNILGDCYGVDKWEQFFAALRDSEGNEVFTICPDTTINMAEMEANALAPLLVRAGGITLKCGSQRRGSCVLSGGTTHILLQKNLESFKVQYITMEKASVVSVTGTPILPFSIEFENCDWKNNSGVATVKIDAIDPSNPLPRNNDITGTRSLLEDNENYFVCDRCMFSENIVRSSIIAVSDTTLVLDAVDFRANTANGSLISITRGSIVLKDSCIVESTSTTLIEANDSEVVTEEVYLSGNSGSNCSGYSDNAGNCVEPDPSDSCVAAENRCYAHWDDLSDVMAKTAGNGEPLIFTVCDNTILDVSNSALIEISTSKTTIRCGLNGARDNSCLIKGGSVQFKIIGSPTDVLFSGLSFSEASEAAIYAGGERSAKAQVTDCLFRDMKRGQASILVYGGDGVPSANRNRRSLAIDDFSEPLDRSMTVEIGFSSFLSNTVELAPIANLKGTILVANCDFDQNRGSAGGIGGWFGGSMSLSTSCFTDNTGQLAGSVYVDGDSTTESGNYSGRNEAIDGACLDLYLSKATVSEGEPQGFCEDFSATVCGSQAAPTASPTIVPTLPILPTVADSLSRAPLDCIDNWDGLREAVQNKFTPGIENVFTLCPDVTLEATGDPILLDQDDSNIIFECDRNGQLRDSCSISGGAQHFRIFAQDIAVAFKGISFEGSTDLSILAAADKASTARFEKCQWIGHTGGTVVLIYSEADGQEYEGQTPIAELPLSDASMTVSFEDCIFKDNPVTDAIVFNVGGTSTFTLTAFDNNNREIDSAAIVARSEAQLELTECCFIKNDSGLPGTAYLIEKSEISVNKDNYGGDNRVRITTCTDIFTLAPGEVCTSTSCLGACSTFDSPLCQIPGYEYVVPSAPPSFTPIEENNDDGQFSGGESHGFVVGETSLYGSGYFWRSLFVGALIAVALL